MDRNKDPILNGLLHRMTEGVGHLCPSCQNEVVKNYMDWHPQARGQSKADILEREIERILHESSPEDAKRLILEKLFSIKDPDLLRFFYFYQCGFSGHLLHYAYLKQRYLISKLK